MNQYTQPKQAITFFKQQSCIRAHVRCPICNQSMQCQHELSPYQTSTSNEMRQFCHENMAAQLNRLFVEHIYSHYGDNNWGNIQIIELSADTISYEHTLELIENRIKSMTFLQKLRFVFTRKYK